MALTLVERCSCGNVFQIYVTKRRAAILSGRGDPEEAWHVDMREEAAGEIEAAEHVAKKIGAEFIDTREGQKFPCGKCGTIHDSFELFQRGGRGMPTKYYLTIFAGQNMDHPLAQFDSPSPFGAISVGDILDGSAWKDINPAEMDFRVLNVEHFIHKMEHAKEVSHVVRLYTEAVTGR